MYAILFSLATISFREKLLLQSRAVIINFSWKKFAWSLSQNETLSKRYTVQRKWLWLRSHCHQPFLDLFRDKLIDKVSWFRERKRDRSLRLYIEIKKKHFLPPRYLKNLRALFFIRSVLSDMLDFHGFICFFLANFNNSATVSIQETIHSLALCLLCIRCF